MPSVTANGLDIGYEVHGAGPPLILLHGATSSGREDFAAQVPLFSKAFRVFLPDARGHATTRWDAANGWTFAELVDDVAAFADAIGLATFHLLGFSMGAMTALQFAVRWPERLRTLIVAGITHPARAADERRPTADGPGLDRPERADAGRDPVSPARPGPGCRRLAHAPPGDRPRHRGPAAARPARPPSDRASGDGLRRRSRRVRPRRPRLGPGSPAARRSAARGAGLRCTRSSPAGRPCSTRHVPSSTDRPRRSLGRRSAELATGRPTGRDRRRIAVTTLLALFRRPEGGDEARWPFERAYAETHLPLVADTPGLRSHPLRPGRRGAGRRDRPRPGDRRWTSTIGRRSTPGWRPMRCARPAATCATSPRGCRRCSCSNRPTSWSPAAGAEHSVDARIRPARCCRGRTGSADPPMTISKVDR